MKDEELLSLMQVHIAGKDAETRARMVVAARTVLRYLELHEPEACAAILRGDIMAAVPALERLGRAEVGGKDDA